MTRCVKRPAAPLVPFFAALPVAACMAILGLPALGHGYAAAFRALYFVACMAWCVPLAHLQRALWRRERSLPFTALVLLAARRCSRRLSATPGKTHRIPNNFMDS
jgi:two-component system sensor histidine kinase AlgZ